MDKISIRFFNDTEVRAVWDEEHSKWWFSVLDIIGVLNEQHEYEDRAMVELEIRYVASVQDIVGIIEQVEVTANIGRASEKNLIGVNENGEN